MGDGAASPAGSLTLRKATNLQHCHWVIDFRFAFRQLFKFARFHFLALITVD
jgi:hypothetical protein